MNKGSLASARVSKILQMSRDFQIHRNNIIGIKTRESEAQNLKKRANQISQFLKQKSQHSRNIQSLKLQQVQRENWRLVQRLKQIVMRNPRKDSLRSSSNQGLGSLRISRTSSAKSLHRSYRMSESKRIVRENTELGGRIINARPQKLFQLKTLKKQYRNQQKYVRSISRFSEKNKDRVTKVVEKGLMLKKQSVTFLPNIIKRRIKTSRDHH